MFKLNPNEARAYDQRGGYINQAGKYSGYIESAVWYISHNKNGRSENIRLTFVADTKQKATFFINTSHGGGTANEGGLKLVSALLACLKLRQSGEPVPCPVKEYNPDNRQEETVTRDCFTQLHNKPLGIVVQMVHEDGRDNPSPSIYSVFEPAREMTAGEILNQAAAPQQLAKVVAYIADKPLHDKRKSQPGNNTNPPPPPQHRPNTRPAAPADDIDDDIPF